MSKLIANFDEILKNLPAGAWVAISERKSEAVAHGWDARIVLDEARVRGEQIPLMVRVPERKAFAA